MEMAGTTTSNPTRDRLVMALSENGADAAIRIIFQLSTDAELVKAWQATDGTPGDPILDLLEAEMQRREIDF